MKTADRSTRQRTQGYALLMVMVLMAALLVTLVSTFGRTTTTEKLNNRNNKYTAGLYAAEAATEKVIARMKYDFLAGNLTYITNDLSTYHSSVPTAADDPYWSNFSFNDAAGNNSATYVQCISNSAWAPLSSQYAGLNGWVTVYRVLSNAQQSDAANNPVSAVQQDVELDGIPVFGYLCGLAIIFAGSLCVPVSAFSTTM